MGGNPGVSTLTSGHLFHPKGSPSSRVRVGWSRVRCLTEVSLSSLQSQVRRVECLLLRLWVSPIHSLFPTVKRTIPTTLSFETGRSLTPTTSPSGPREEKTSSHLPTCLPILWTSYSAQYIPGLRPSASSWRWTARVWDTSVVSRVTLDGRVYELRRCTVHTVGGGWGTSAQGVSGTHGVHPTRRDGKLHKQCVRGWARDSTSQGVSSEFGVPRQLGNLTPTSLGSVYV